MGRFWRKLWMLFRRRQMERDLDEEIRFHLEMQAEEGVSPAHFGNVALVRETAREAWGWPNAEDWLRELRYAIRGLRRSPVSSITVMLSLGIGIGVAAGVFAIADALFVRAPDLPAAKELVSVYQRGDNGRGAFTAYAWLQYEHLRKHSRAFQEVSAFARIPVNVYVADSARRVSSELVSNNYFEMLRVAPAVGRAFHADDGNVVMIGHRFWQTNFAGAPDVIGAKIMLNGHPFIVVGVLPESFRGIVLDWGKPPDVWLPISAYRSVSPGLPLEHPSAWWLLVTGRLRPGTGIDQAQSEVEAISADYADAHGMRDDLRLRSVVLPVQEARFWPGQRTAVLNYVRLLAAVALLTLVMACFNVANLLLSRAERRKRELAVQVAIGAGRMRLARSLLLETFLLALGGAVVGLGLAWVTPLLLDRFHNPLGVPVSLDLRLNVRVLMFIAAMAVLASALAGLSPLRLAWRMDVNNAIRNGADWQRARGFRLTDALVVAQVAICLVTLTGAGLFLRSLRHAMDSDPLFRAGNGLLVAIDLYSAGYNEARGTILQRELLRRVRELPGAEAAAYVKTVPLSGFRPTTDIDFNGAKLNVQVNTVSPGYFATVGLPLIRGRDIRAGETGEAVINERMAERLWPGEEPLGKQFRMPRRQALRVVGVVRDGRMRSFRDRDIQPCLYLPVDAGFQPEITLYIRTTGNPLMASEAVRATLRDLDPTLPFQAVTLEAHLLTAVARERLAATLLTALGGFTTLLAAVGLYGLISVAVSQRSREIGIRMALGARRGGAVLAIIRRFAWLPVLGGMVGLIASVWLSRFVESWVFGVEPTDPLAISGALCLLAAVTAIAAGIPAARAAFRNPISVLRQD